MSKIFGYGVPTSNTYGILGQEYIDKLTGTRYICIKSKHVTSDKAGEADHYCEWEPEGVVTPIIKNYVDNAIANALGTAISEIDTLVGGDS